MAFVSEENCHLQIVDRDTQYMWSEYQTLEDSIAYLLSPHFASYTSASFQPTEERAFQLSGTLGT